MQVRRGFTLLELMMVVIIIGILAAIAMPNFIKAAEKARASGALSYAGAVRSAEKRYSAQDQNNEYAIDPRLLDISIDVPTGWRTPNFSVSAPSGGNPPIGFVTLERNGGQFDGQTLGVQLGTGTVCGTFTVYDPGLPACVQD